MGKGREGYTYTLRGHQGVYMPRDHSSTKPQLHLPRLLLILFISGFLPSVVVVLVTIVLFISIGLSNTLYLCPIDFLITQMGHSNWRTIRELSINWCGSVCYKLNEIKLFLHVVT